MSIQHLFNLSLVLAFKNLQDGLLVVLSLLFVLAATLLELLNSHLELLLGLNKVSLVVVLLSFKEHNFAFPKCLVSVIVALKILELSLSFLESALHLKKILCLNRAILVSLISTIV
jgi:hypothetical protein